MIELEYLNLKIYLLKDILLIGVEKYLLLIKMSSQCFPPFGGTSNDIKVELDLSSYPTKDDVKNITHVDVSSYATKANLAALETEVDKIDTGKLKAVPDDLAKLSNVVKSETVKKATYNTLKNKVDAIDTSGFVTRTKFTTDTNARDDKINKYNNTKHSTFKMKSKDVKDDNNRVYIDEHNKKVLDII